MQKGLQKYRKWKTTIRSTSLKKVEFKPRYSFVINYLDPLIGITYLGFIFYFSFTDNNILLLIPAITLLILVLNKQLTRPRKILISKNEIVIKRFLLPSLNYSFSELTDLGLKSIRFGKSKISLLEMKNSSKLISSLFELMDEGGVQVDKMEKKLAFEEELYSKSRDKAIVPSLLVVTLTWLLFDAYRIELKFMWLALFWCLIFGLMVSVSYYFDKRKIKPDSIEKEYEFFKRNHTPLKKM